MRVGEPRREVVDVPRPVRAPKFVPERGPKPMEPFRRKEAVPVRRTLEPARRALGTTGMTIEEIPYGCPHCGLEMNMEDGILSCPRHGIISEY